MSPAGASKDGVSSEITVLRRQVDELQREKADLELLIETNIEHSDFIEDDLLQKLEVTKQQLLTKIFKLRRGIFNLRQKVTKLKREKADLELLLEMNTEHLDSIEEELLRKVESTLRESERRFRLISETIPVPITVSRVSDQRIVYANEPASLFFGIPIEALREYNVLDFYDPASQQSLLAPLSNDGYVNNYELHGKKIDGMPFYGALYARSLTFNNEPCLLCALYDMTERKRAENEIRILNEELEERVKKRTQELEEAHAIIMKLEKEAVEIQMAGGFAHEMRNTLVGAKLMLESMTDHAETLCLRNAEILGQLYDAIISSIPEENRNNTLDYFARLEQNEERLDNVFRMVDQSITRALDVTTLILEYSKLGRTAAGDERVDLRKVIEQVIHDHATDFVEHGIAVYPRLFADTPLLGYESHFYSMINNLVLNARDELVELEDDRQRFIEIWLHQEDQTLLLSVTDNADGIPDDILPKIFEPFFSTKPTTGTGLGLSFISKLVPMYDGKIEVNNEVHQGTTFILTFPIKPTEKRENDGI